MASSDGMSASRLEKSLLFHALMIVNRRGHRIGAIQPARIELSSSVLGALLDPAHLRAAGVQWDVVTLIE